MALSPNIIPHRQERYVPSFEMLLASKIFVHRVPWLKPLLRFGCVWGCLVGLAGAAEPRLTTEAQSKGVAIPAVDYGRHIRPILSNNCFKCHGPDEDKRQGELRLDLPQNAGKTTESGRPAIVAGNPEASELVARITSTKSEQRMPPTDSNKKLTAQEIDLLRTWIAQGADHKLHWSYVKPQRHTMPVVQHRDWLRTDIDSFILQRLEKAGFKPAAEANRTTLIRRLSLDITGLPPTIDEVDAFVNDAGPDAYEKLVDRLLASPHFGERMAQDWLDLSRYGDTNGYENDSDRAIWKYRDWVIRAFAQNMPFDQFTIEQIAGDLLPNATLEQRTATGFSRNVTYNEEQGADPDEYAIKYGVDRTSTTAAIFLGMTMGCAECHDHKYDPISQKDFYSLFAFFNSIDGEKGAEGHDVPLPPLLKFPTAEQASAYEEVRAQIAELEKQIAQELSQIEYEEQAVVSDETLAKPMEYSWVDDALPIGAVARGTEAEKSWQWVESPVHQAFSRKLSHTRTAKGLGQHYFVNAENGMRIGQDDILFAYVFLDPQNPPKTIMLQFDDGNWEHRAFWGEDLVPWGTAGTASRLSRGALPNVGGWVRLEVAAQEIGLSPGAVVHGMAFTQVDGKVFWDNAGLLTRTVQPLRPMDSQALWEKFELGPPNPPSKLPRPLLDTLQIPTAKRNERQKADVQNYFVRFIYDKTRPQFDPLNKQFNELKAAETKLDKAIPSTMVMAEMPKRRSSFVLMRGNYQTPGEEVSPNVPSFLPPLAAGQPSNRLGLARWLVNKENPLTARVTVNRLWKRFFGAGLVKTTDDFGSQGEFPSHPELLDWLAAEWMAPDAHSGTNSSRNNASAGTSEPWDMKALCRLMVCSSTYRQAANPQRSVSETDPSNRLLSHGARFRLSAELIRDNALAISGLLNRQIGGKSVFPYQPADYYADKGRWKWTQSTGGDLYRRGLYTFWRRTTFYPSFQVFDAPTRENCTVDRPVTNTPLQALVTLNDPTFVEAARIFGQRIMQEGGESVSEKLTFAFRLCVARSPQANELEVLQRLFATQVARFQANEAAAAALVGNGTAPRPENLPIAELAAWTAMGNVLLNLDETITRE